MKQGKGNRKRMKSRGMTAGALTPLTAQAKTCLSLFKNPALWAGLFGAVTFALSMVIPVPAIAGPDPVEVIDESTVVAKGDQSDGVASGVDFDTPPVFTVNVLDLDWDITPEEGVAGIRLEDQGAPGTDGGSGQPGQKGGDGHGGLTVNFTGEDHGIVTEGDDAMGIVVQSSGGHGGRGGSGGIANSGGAGGKGGEGGSVTVTSSGAITTSGDKAHGIAAQTFGGQGGKGGSAFVWFSAGHGGHGGLGGSVTVTSDSAITTSGDEAHGIAAQVFGGEGGAGGGANSPVGEPGGDPLNQSSAGHGGAGFGNSEVTVTSSGAITTSGDKAHGIAAQVFAGKGGDGGGADVSATAGHGGQGGRSGPVTVTSTGAISTSGKEASAIVATTSGGAGGKGGDATDVVKGIGGDGGHGGPGDNPVTVTSSGAIATSGDKAHGIAAQSLGGAGGKGGQGVGALYGYGAAGGYGGDSGPVTVTSSGAITTSGEEASAIFALSQGGTGGVGGAAYAGGAQGGDGGIGGRGLKVTVTSDSAITTSGDKAQGIAAQSLGGAGGAGGWGAGFVGRGGATMGGGDGGPVEVVNRGGIETFGKDSRGILAQSVGGFAGSGGLSIGFIAFGAGGESGGDGGAVTVDNSTLIRTHGLNSSAILAQSVGGGGGAAGSIGVFALGGKGNAGGNSTGVTVTNTGGLRTSGADASGILAQSIGGGGGHGGFAVSAGAFGSVAVGGQGGKGGDGGGVAVDSGQVDIVTEGDRSVGIFAQSVGGGGGHGGFAVSVAAGKYVSANLALGGNGGDGGGGSTVSVDSESTIDTSGEGAHGIFAQSVGGGGGTGGFSIALSAGYEGWDGAFSWGGTGGGGGGGKDVFVNSTEDITTRGFYSYGILAQSLGGGGGTGGFSIAGSLSYGAATSVSIGGKGGGGGDGEGVTVNSAGDILTYGEQSHGLFVQSVGGGGGAGGFSIAFAGANEGGGVNVAVGGKGGGGGDGGDVTVYNLGSIETAKKSSYGIFAQSVGGGGGSGGFAGSFAVCLDQYATVAVAVGGAGGTGGDGGTVTVDNQGAITTRGEASHGMFVQSAGGGGGDGGFGLAAVGAGGKGFDVAVAVGGTGGDGGKGDGVEVDNTGPIETFGEKSYGILAQSVGGGGGAGGFSIAGEVNWDSPFMKWAVSVGGSGGGGGDGSTVTLDNQGAITTRGKASHGIFAQSVGGGGGNASFSFAGTFLGKEAKNFAVSVGGWGGHGGNGGAVDVTNRDTVATFGNESHAIFAQSVGDGGGTGGYSIAVAGQIQEEKALNISVAVGGTGGEGGKGGDVSVRNEGLLVTHGDESAGIFAQSVGGGGGAGGGSMAATGTYKAKNSFNLSVSIGGNGGTGGDGGNVAVSNDGEIYTLGGGSYGIFAQSIGKGGGAGGSARAMTLEKGSENSKSLSLSIGGVGGDASHGGSVTVNNTGSITTSGGVAYGIFAQSVGGGGGVGGEANQGAGLPIAESGGAGEDKDKKDKNGIFNNVTISIGGNGGAGGDGGTISVTNSGNIETRGHNSSAIIAQSVGGGGGQGGNGIVSKEGTFSLGGDGGVSGDGGAVNVTNSGNITTFGVSAFGIRAKSVGGGGGAAGNTEMGEKGKVTIGGKGGAAGDGGEIKVTNSGAIATFGDGGLGIFAQSVGGGGGSGGSINPTKKEKTLSDDPEEKMSFSIAIGGSGGAAGDGGSVTIDNTGSIATQGYKAYGIFAQSVGGGGGVGGDANQSKSKSLLAEGSTEDQDEKPIELTVFLGGSGEGGGDGGAVSITNSGSITTMGDDSYGIYAQSIGGGGGHGGNGTIGTKVTVVLGGSGNVAGDGGAVEIANSGGITTLGDTAFGILAQSIGGGGGSAPSADLGGKGTVTIGGAGGAGGDGGAVKVTNSGSISTFGDDSSAIFAQSVGGGGGSGGSINPTAKKKTMSGDPGEEMSFDVAIGGSGGAAGQGGSVSINNAGSITTEGGEAYGIFAQSVGGGGGHGGNVNRGKGESLLAAGSTKDQDENRVNLTVSLGGSGGSSGDGGTVSVTNSGDMETFGDGSSAIFAQSIGGGGGSGGSINPTAKKETLSSGSGKETSFKVAMGGAGGAAGDGGSVNVANSGKIKTSGGTAFGIFAQSVGGGGGHGGNANQGKDRSLLAAGSAEDQNENPTNLTISLGGFSGSSGDGGSVSVTNSGDMETSGDGSYGIFAQSVGGGGGAGANGTIASKVTVVLGGSGGAAGDGGTVEVTNNGSITTFGGTAFGIFAQSIGGGGGAAANVDMGAKGSIAIGGAGGAGGDGGTVSVTNNGSIVTFGDGSSAIFAQSVGGGGGVAGDVKQGSNSFGLNVAIGRAGGNGGDGGTVTVTNTSDIFTAGKGAHGIFAQSVGGGGGLVGNLGEGIQFAGSVGAIGSGSDVKIIQEGNITTTGDRSQGIFAQSAGGKGTGGKVDITVAGSISASGTDSHAILAQSRGDSGAGNISINIANVLVEGGTGEGAGVRFIEGSSNTLTNHGTIFSANRMAIIGSTGNETIDNFGIIAGSVDLGGGMNAFNNHPGALFLPGPIFKLGPGCAFVNSGFFSPGSTADGETTVLGSDFLQTSTGVYEVWVRRDGHTSQLRVNGTAKLGGTIEVIRGMGPYYDGTTFNVLEAVTVENSFSQEIMPNTPLLTFTTNYFRDPAQLNVVQVALQAHSFTTVATNRVEFTIGQYLDRVLRQATGDFSFVLGEFQALSMPEFSDAFASLSPNIYDADGLITSDITRQYAGTLRQRLRTLRRDLASGKGGPQVRSSSYSRPVLLAYNGSDRNLGQLLSGSESAREGRMGVWIEGFGQFGNQKRSDGFGGFDYTTGGGTFGLDLALTERLVTGASFGYSHASMDLDNDFGTGTVKSHFGSVYGTYFAERAYLDGTASYGKHDYDNRREIRIGSIRRTAESDHDGRSFSFSAETGYRFSFKKFMLQPFASLLYTRLREESLEESGADSLNMKVDSRRIDSLISELGLRLTRPVEISKGTLIPEISAAWQHDFAVDDRTMAVSFTGAPSGFTLEGRDQDRNGALVGVGLTLVGKGGFTASVRYNGEFRSSYDAHGVSGQIRFSF